MNAGRGAAPSYVKRAPSFAWVFTMTRAATTDGVVRALATGQPICIAIGRFARGLRRSTLPCTAKRNACHEIDCLSRRHSARGVRQQN